MITFTIGYIFIVTVFCALLQAITGFGFGLAAAPLILFVMDPKDVVMFLLITASVNNLLMIFRTWRGGSVRSLWILFAASIVGSLPGGYLLKIISSETLKLVIGVLLVASAFALSAKISVKIKRPKLAQTLVGLLSGVLGATTSFSGPPVILYFLNENHDKEAIRANMARFFLLGNCVALLLAYYFGILQVSGLVIPVAVSIPAIALGIWLGDKLFLRLDADAFRKIALWTIASTALANIGASVLPYFH